MNLAEVKIGQNCKILRVGTVGPLKRRLMDMGMIIGEKLQIEKIAPLGDPIELTIKNYKLSLRKSEAKMIDVELIYD